MAKKEGYYMEDYQREDVEEMARESEVIRIVPMFMYIDEPNRNRGVKYSGTYSSLPKVGRSVAPNEYLVPFLVQRNNRKYFNSLKFEGSVEGKVRVIEDFLVNLRRFRDEMKEYYMGVMGNVCQGYLIDGKDYRVEPAEFYYSNGTNFSEALPNVVAFEMGMVAGVLDIEAKPYLYGMGSEFSYKNPHL